MDREGTHFEDGRADQHLESLLIAARRGRRPGIDPRAELYICPQCDSDFVYPLDWSQAGEDRWSVELRCPECEWHGSGVYDQDVLDRFDVELDAGTAAVIDDLADLTRANMEDEADRFLVALRGDLILPEDF